MMCSVMIYHTGGYTAVIGYFTTPSSFRSRVRVIVSVSTPILYPTTSAQLPRLNRRPRRSTVSVDRQNPEVLTALQHLT